MKNGNNSLRPAIESQTLIVNPKLQHEFLQVLLPGASTGKEPTSLRIPNLLCLTQQECRDCFAPQDCISSSPKCQLCRDSERLGWELGDRSHRCVLHDTFAISPSEKRSIAAPPRQPLASLIQIVAAPHFRLESLWALAVIVVVIDGLIQLPIKGTVRCCRYCRGWLEGTGDQSSAC